MMKEKTKFWANVVPIFAVGLVVAASLGANWVGLIAGAVACALVLWVQVSKYGYGYATKHLWRFNPIWKWPRRERRLDS